MSTFRIEHNSPHYPGWHDADRDRPTGERPTTEKEAIRKVDSLLNAFSRYPDNEGLVVRAVKLRFLLPDKVIYSRVVRL